MGAKVVKQKDLRKNKKIPHIKTTKIIDITDGTSSSFTKVISDMNKSNSFLKNIAANSSNNNIKSFISLGSKVVKNKKIPPLFKTKKIIDLTDGTSSSFSKVISDMNKSSSFLKNISGNNHSSFLKNEVENSKDPFHVLQMKAKRVYPSFNHDKQEEIFTDITETEENEFKIIHIKYLLL